jgi:hypothetical protein
VTTPDSQQLVALLDRFQSVATQAMDIKQWRNPYSSHLAVAVNMLWHSLYKREMGFKEMIRGICE